MVLRIMRPPIFRCGKIGMGTNYTRGQIARTAYALSLKRNEGYALVSMEAAGFKTMGPMRYNCAYVAQ